MLSAGSLCAKSSTRFVFHIRIYHLSDRIRIKGEAKCFRQGGEWTREWTFALQERNEKEKNILSVLIDNDSEIARKFGAIYSIIHISKLLETFL